MTTQKLTVHMDEIKKGDRFPGGGVAIQDAEIATHKPWKAWIVMDKGILLEEVAKTIEVEREISDKS